MDFQSKGKRSKCHEVLAAWQHHEQSQNVTEHRIQYGHIVCNTTAAIITRHAHGKKDIKRIPSCCIHSICTEYDVNASLGHLS